MVWGSSDKKHTIAIIALDANGKANASGFNTVFDGNTTYGMQYQYTTLFNNHLPGNYRIIAGYTTKPPLSFSIDRRHLLAELLGQIPIQRKSNNYGLMLNFDQYLWTKSTVVSGKDKFGKSITVDERNGLPPLGVGIYARAGWTPKDRNVIDQFYSAGIGGYGCPFSLSRPNDNWGIGYAYSHISSDVRNLLSALAELNTAEHGFELFYNFAITPAIKFTVNGQIIRSPLTLRQTAYTGGGRLRVFL